MNTPTDRRTFLRGATATLGSATGAALLAACGSNGASKSAIGASIAKVTRASLTSTDLAILRAAQVAEALAVTTYSNIIDSSPFFANIQPAFQHYLTAARQEEMSHYDLEQSLTGTSTSATSFFYPPKMFSDAQTTLNVLVSLEDAFIAAYLVGVRDFSTPALRVTAARIMGIESDHRALARVIAPNVAAKDNGPITRISGFQKQAEPVDPANNNTYERTLGLRRASAIAIPLGPFIEHTAAKRAGFDTSAPFAFKPFKPTAPEPLGDFHSLSG